MHRQSETTMLNTNTHSDCFAALAELNDVGMMLIDQNCFVPALVTFREAMQAVRTCMTLLSEPDRSSNASIDLVTVLDQAHARLVSAQPVPCAIFPAACQMSSAEDLLATHDLNSIMRDLNHGSESTVGIFLKDTRIFDSLPRDLKLDLFAGIIMNNFGIAHHAYATFLQGETPLKNSSKYSRYQDDSLQFMTLSEMIFERLTMRLLHHDDDDLEVDYKALRAIFLLHSAVLATIFHFSVGTPQVVTVRAKLVSVYSGIATFSTFDCRHAPAA